MSTQVSKTLKPEDFLLPEGRLRITKHFDEASGGHTEVVFEDDNLIVTQGKMVLLTNLYFTSGNADPLAYAKFGTGGAVDPGGVFPRTPTPDMTNLFAPVSTIPIVKTNESPLVPSITLLARVDNVQGNGLFINEAGFFTASGKMFNIKVFPGITKNSSFSLSFEWIIKVL